MKLLWTGTDAWLLRNWPKQTKRRYPYTLCLRLFARIADLMVQEHYVDHAYLKKFLRFRKPVKVFKDPVWHPRPFMKLPHKGFNVVYYCPDTSDPFKRWIYGYDIYLELVRTVPGVTWIVLDGKQNMSLVWTIADFYLRPNRNDGASRLRQEAKINGVPYYWTQENPSLEDARKEIERCLK